MGVSMCRFGGNRRMDLSSERRIDALDRVHNASWVRLDVALQRRVYSVVTHHLADVLSGDPVVEHRHGEQSPEAV